MEPTTAIELARTIRRGDGSSLLAADAALSRIAAVEPIVRAWAWLDGDRCVAAARQLDRLPPERQATLPLLGVPVGLKDVFNTVDMPTQMGSPLWAGFTPGNDARVVFALRQAGAVFPGKTTTSEFAVHAPTETRNPRSLDRSPGTSSAGSAAAVASGMVPVALGTQTGGSIIRPASYCGVLGFKPSFGVVPRTGVLKTTDTLDTIGWFSRSVEDARLLFEILRVRGPNYPFVYKHVVPSEVPHPLRVGLFRGPHWSTAEPEAREALLTFAKLLGDAGGFEVDDVDLPEAEEIDAAHDMIYCKSLAYYFRGERRDGAPAISHVLLSMIERGERVQADAYQQSLERQATLTRDVSRRFRHDIWITLAAAGEAPPPGVVPEPADSSRLWTYLGMPALNLPAFRSGGGLPIGLQVVARKYADYVLLAAAERLWTLGEMDASVAELRAPGAGA